MNKGSQQLRLLFGLALIGLGAIWLVSNAGIFGDVLITGLWIIGLAAFAGGFIWVYRGTKELWALLGAYISVVILAIILLSEIDLSGSLVAVFTLLSIAGPFVYIWWNDREQWWALIPAYVMVAISGVVLLSEVLTGNLIATYVMWAVALPFGLLFLAKPQENWWALIPGSIVFLIGLGLAASELFTSGAGPTVAVALVLIGSGGLMLYNSWRSR